MASTSASSQTVGMAAQSRSRSNSTKDANDLLKDHYEVGRTIGEGGFAKVKLATV